MKHSNSNVWKQSQPSRGKNRSRLTQHFPFDELLYTATQAFAGSILILFDQFEEYFLYHPESEAGNTFDIEFARAINREEVDASFLIALRDDGLSKLDRLRRVFPICSAILCACSISLPRTPKRRFASRWRSITNASPRRSIAGHHRSELVYAITTR